MRHRTLFSVAGLMLLILIGAFAPQVAQADGYYWRWTSAPDAECGPDGDDYLSTDARNYEYNLPAGATLDEYIINNGVSAFQGNFPAPSGAGAGSYSNVEVNGPDPFTYAFQFDTVIGGKIVYRSTLTFACTTVDKETNLTVTITNEAFGGAGECLPIPDGSVVGDMPNGVQAFYAPDKIAPDVFINPGTYWVLGEDESEQFYKILLACQYLWVPVETMQPSFQSPWSGQPLPTQVVS
jgi:hypothetical protein